MNVIVHSLLAGAMTLALAASALAHHSAAAYDTRTEVKVTGTIVQYRFANPHVYLTLQVKNADGSTTTTDVEAGAASVLNGLGFTKDSVAVGDVVTVVGNPDRTNAAAAPREGSLQAGRDLCSAEHRVTQRVSGKERGGDQHCRNVVLSSHRIHRLHGRRQSLGSHRQRPRRGGHRGPEGDDTKGLHSSRRTRADVLPRGQYDHRRAQPRGHGRRLDGVSSASCTWMAAHIRRQIRRSCTATR